MAATLAEQAAVPPTFECFYEATYERLLRAMYLVAGSRSEAEDLAQEAMARAYERWDRVSAVANPAGYLYRTALNLHRSRLRRVSLAARKAVRRQEVDAITAADERDSIRRALQALPSGQREALVIVIWLGMSVTEAAGILGTSPGAVRVRLSRARQALRPLLRGDDDG